MVNKVKKNKVSFHLTVKIYFIYSFINHWLFLGYSFEDNLIEDDSIATQNTNDSSSKNSFDFLNELKLEEALIQGEIDELTNKQNHNENNDDEDEDLKEFKRIENEIKISELNKSLEAIKNEIKKIDYRIT